MDLHDHLRHRRLAQPGRALERLQGRPERADEPAVHAVDAPVQQTERERAVLALLAPSGALLLGRRLLPVRGLPLGVERQEVVRLFA